MKKFPLNPLKNTAASSLSGCIHRFLSKVIISLPTKSEFVDVFEKTLIGGISCVNTRLAFGTSILLPKDQNGNRRKNLKLINKTRSKNNNNYEDKTLVGKIPKMDENKQCGNALTKLLPTGSIKRSRKTPTIREFNLITEGISDEDKIGHFFIVDVEFNEEKASEKHLLFNEIYTPIFEKKKVLPPTKRSIFKLLDVMRLNDKGLFYMATSKTHSTMGKKFFIPPYAKYIRFLIKRCEWIVTRIYSHYTFEQSKFKKHFVIMNQVSRQRAKTSFGKEFFKLMNKKLTLKKTSTN